MENTTKTNEQRIRRIYELAESHWGTVKFVGLKYDKYDGWIAKVAFHNPNNVGPNSFKAHADDPTEALRKLKKTIKRSIHRYMTV